MLAEQAYLSRAHVRIGAAARGRHRREGVEEGLLGVAQEDEVLGAARTGQTRPHLAEVELHDPRVVGIGRVRPAEQSLETAVLLHAGHVCG